MTSSNPALRRKATELTHRNLGTLVLMYLIQYGITFGITFVLTFAILFVAMFGLVVQTSTLADQAALSKMDSMELFTEVLLHMVPALLLALPFFIAAFMFIGSLRCGQIKAQTDMARGGKPGVGTLFCRLKNIFGCFGLDMWVSLKTLLWMLPGYAMVIIAAVIVTLRALNGILSVPVALFALFLMLGGLALMLALGIPAGLRYTLAPIIFAENPAVGILRSVRESKSIMAGRKAQLFTLLLPYILLVLAGYVVYMLMTWLGNTYPFLAVITPIFSLAYIVLAAYIGFLSMMATCCFYVESTTPQPEADPQA